MIQLTEPHNLRARYDFKRLAAFLLIGLSVLAGWQSAPCVSGQKSSHIRFTESLKLQEIEPGIEYGQTTSGKDSKDELTGPWLINVLRIDLRHARLKVVHALDEGVGVETRKNNACFRQRWSPENRHRQTLVGKDSADNN
jgi:hypothetical protein